MTKQQWLITSAGVKVPPLIYGTAWKKQKTADLVEEAVLAGFRGIDTAAQPKHYDESLVGEALLRLKERGLPREGIYIQTKFTPLAGQDPDRIPYDANSYLGEQVHQSFQQSCLNLHTDHVDCLILHSPLKTLALTMEAWKAMEAIHDAGGARQLGISNCYDQTFLDALHAETTVKPAIIQNRFFQQTDYDADLRQRCQDLGVLYESFWTLTANPHILGHREVRKIAEKRQKSEAQILFRYLTQLGIVPLTGTISAKHMQEDLAIFEFDLNDEERQSMDLLLSIQLP